MDINELLSRFTEEERTLLMSEVAKSTRKAKGPKTPKELPAELVAAQAALASFESENSSVIRELRKLEAEVSKHRKSVHVRLSTRQYRFQPETGDPGIYDKTTNELICVFKEEGWQDQFTGAGYTHGQVQAIYKAMSTLKKKNESTQPVANA